jgi:polysaccharide biosynthesis protein PelF
MPLTFLPQPVPGRVIAPPTTVRGATVGQRTDAYPASGRVRRLPWRTARAAADVVLVTEGTYPHAHGGVSVWCDQLVTGLPELTFRVVALTAFGYQRPIYDLPPHADHLTTVGLWDAQHLGRRGRASSVADGPAEAAWAAAAAGASGAGASRASRAATLAALVAGPVDDVAGFRRFLDGLAPLGPDEIARQLCFGELLVALDAELRAPRWGATGGVRASDLVQAAEILDHLMRPVAVEVGPAPIYHASSNGLAALVCMLAQRRHGGQFLLTEHGIYLRERYIELRRSVMARPAKALLLRFHRLVTAAAYAEATVIAPGSDWNQRWESRHGAPAHRLRTIYNGIDPSQFPTRPAEPASPVVSWLGRIDPIKDLETLIRAFAVVHARRPDARLRLYGRTPSANEDYRSRLERLVSSLGLDAVVTFEGGVARSADAYRDAQIGVLSSISEGFPYSLIEAMACGLPTVATGVGGVPEAVGDTGIVVTPRAPDQLGAAILELLDDDARRRRLGPLARERVLGRFTLDACLTGYRRLYAELRAGGPMDPPDPPDRSSPQVPAHRVGAGAGSPRCRITAAGPSTYGSDRPWDSPPVPVPGNGKHSAVPAPAPVPGNGKHASAPAAPAPGNGHIAARGNGLGPRNGHTAAQAVDEPPVLPEAEVDALLAAAGGRAAVAGAVDVDEVAATFESVGLTDGVAVERFGSADVFDLAQRARAEATVEHDPATPRHRPRERPKVPLPSARGALGRGLTYVLPAVVVAAASLAGAPQGALVAASSVGWGLAQGGGVLAFTVLHRTGATTLAPVRRALLAVVAAIAVGGLAVGAATSSRVGVAFALPLLHLVGAAALVLAQRTRLVLAAVTPVSLLSVAALARPGSRAVELVAPVSVATVALTLLLVAVYARGPRPRERTLERIDWVRSLPLVGCGWVTAAFALLAVSATSDVRGLDHVDSRQWLLLGLPLWVMVAGGEWLLIRIRRSLRVLLEDSPSIAAFRRTGWWSIVRWMEVAVLAMQASVWVATAASDLAPDAAWRAASVFFLVAVALVGVTVLTVLSRVGLATAVLGLAVAALAGVATPYRNPYGLADHSAALAVCGVAALLLGLAAVRGLADPASQR